MFPRPQQLDARSRTAILPRVAWAALPALAVASGACYGPLTSADAEGRAAALPIDPALRDAPTGEVFSEAAAVYGVPRDLLVALAWHESSLSPEAATDEDWDHHRPAHGWLGLTPARIDLATAVTSYERAAIESSREEGIFGGAAVLDALRDEEAPLASAGSADERWWPVVVAWADLGETWLDHQFALDVFTTLQTGLAAPTADGDVVTIEPREIPGLAEIELVRPPGGESGDFAAGADYPNAARFVASPNYSSRTAGAASIRRVVLHTTEGSYSGAVGWFQNDSSDVSAHFVIRKSDGEITQMVRLDKKAWHACNNNNDTIGIEHEGAASSAATWTPAMLDASARLTAWLVNRYGIPVDRDHIVGHGEIQPASCSYRYDPGSHFPWDWYMQRVHELAVGSSPIPEDPADPPPADLPPPEPETPPAPPAPEYSATVEFQTPANGEVVGNPVLLRIRQTGAHHVEVWRGAARLAYDLVANPVHVGVTVPGTGPKTFTAKAFSASGTVIATDEVTVEVRNLSQTLQPSASPQGGTTFRLNATASGGSTPARVRYWVDGWALKDQDSGSYDAVGAPYSLRYTFSYAGAGRLLQARSYDAVGALIGEGFAYIDTFPAAAPGGSLVQVDDQAASGRWMRFASQAEGDVAKVEYWVDGAKLVDAESGRDHGVPLDYSIWFEFGSSGDFTLEARAFDSAGNLVDTKSRTIYVPSPSLVVAWNRLSSMLYHFDADAPAGTSRVVIEIDDWALPDMNTHNPWAPGPDFLLDYRFNYAGLRQLHAEARDAAGNVLSTYDATLQSY
jgi:hypothetical protein